MRKYLFSYSYYLSTLYVVQASVGLARSSRKILRSFLNWLKKYKAVNLAKIIVNLPAGLDAPYFKGLKSLKQESVVWLAVTELSTFLVSVTAELPIEEKLFVFFSFLNKVGLYLKYHFSAFITMFSFVGGRNSPQFQA